MAKTQPGGFYLGPNGQAHDAWNRPVKEGVTTFNPPPEVRDVLLGLSTEGAVPPIGGQIDSPAPGSDQYRAYETRAREQLVALEKEQERLAEEAEKIRKQFPAVFNLDAFRQLSIALAAGATPKSAAGAGPIGPTLAEHKEAGERQVEQQEERDELLSERGLAIDTRTDDVKKLDKSGQTEGVADMKDPVKKGSSKKE
jgi:hypothetical protein